MNVRYDMFIVQVLVPRRLLEKQSQYISNKEENKLIQ